MPRVRIVTDSTADLPPGIIAAEGLDVTVVPLNVHFGGQTFRDKVDLTNDEFFRRLATSPSLPTTSQPSPGNFDATYRTLADAGAPICSIHLSSKLSGTHDAATIAARATAAAGITVKVIDSGSASLGLGLPVLVAARLARDGATLDDVVAAVEGLLPRIHVVFALDTLEYLQRGGRLGRAQALLGSLLSVKPILRLAQGEVVPVGRERTRSRVLDALIVIAGQLKDVSALGVIHSAARADADTLLSRLGGIVRPPMTRDNVLLADFGPAVGTHTGPGAVGFVAIAAPQ